jgi:hypothetical protein
VIEPPSVKAKKKVKPPVEEVKPEVKLIPKELEPLAQEARRYKSAEEFEKAILQKYEKAYGGLSKEQAGYAMASAEGEVGKYAKVQKMMVKPAGMQGKDIDVLLLVDDTEPLIGKTSVTVGESSGKPVDIIATDGKRIIVSQQVSPQMIQFTPKKLSISPSRLKRTIETTGVESIEPNLGEYDILRDGAKQILFLAKNAPEDLLQRKYLSTSTKRVLNQLVRDKEFTIPEVTQKAQELLSKIPKNLTEFYNQIKGIKEVKPEIKVPPVKKAKPVPKEISLPKPEAKLTLKVGDKVFWKDMPSITGIVAQDRNGNLYVKSGSNYLEMSPRWVKLEEVKPEIKTPPVKKAKPEVKLSETQIPEFKIGDKVILPARYTSGHEVPGKFVSGTIQKLTTFQGKPSAIVNVGDRSYVSPLTKLSKEEVKVPSVEQISKIKPERAEAKTLIEFVRRNGGLSPKDMLGEVGQFSVKESGIIGLVNKNGKSVDKMREAAEKAGWIPEGSTIDDFINILRDDVFRAKNGGNRVTKDGFTLGFGFGGLQDFYEELYSGFKELLKRKKGIPPGVITVLDKAKSKDLNFLRSIVSEKYVAKQFPELAEIISKGIDYSEKIARDTKIFVDKLESSISGLSKQEISNVLTARLVGEAEGITYNISQLKELGLSDKEAKAYQDVQRIVDTIWKRLNFHERHMVSSGRLQKYLDSVKAEIESRTGFPVKELDELAESEGWADFSKALRSEDAEFRNLWFRYRGTKVRIDRIKAQGRIGRIPSYHPHYFDHWKVEIEGRPALWFKSRSEALKEAAKLYEQDNTLQILVRPKVSDFPFMDEATQLTEGSYWRLVKNIEDAASISGEEAREVLIGVAKPRFRRKIFGNIMKRTGAPGFREDLRRDLEQYISSAHRYMYMDEFKHDAVTAWEKIPTYENRLLKEWFETWYKDVLGYKRPSEEWLDNNIENIVSRVPYLRDWFNASFPSRSIMNKTVGVITHLKLGLGNITSGIVNQTQVLMNTLPLVGPKWLGVAIEKLANLSARDRALLTKAGIEIITPKTELYRSGLSTSLGSKASLWFFNKAERNNNALTFLAQFYKSEAEGRNTAEAFKEALGLARKTQFRYIPASKPEILRSQLLKLPLQFKTFIWDQLQLTYDFATLKYGVGAAATHFAVLGSLAGTLGIPGFFALDALSEYFTGYSPKKELQRHFLEHPGKLSDVVLFGLPALLGVDVSLRVGMGDFIPYSVRDLEGPFLGTIDNATRMFAKEEPIEAIKQISPVPGRIAEAIASKEKVRQPWARGATLYRPTTGERIRMGIGLIPLRQAKLRMARDVENYVIRRFDDKIRDKIDELADAIVNKDRNRAHMLRHELNELNKKLSVNYGINPIDNKSLKVRLDNAIKLREQTLAERMEKKRKQMLPLERRMFKPLEIGR